MSEYVINKICNVCKRGGNKLIRKTCIHYGCDYNENTLTLKCEKCGGRCVGDKYDPIVEKVIYTCVRCGTEYC